MADYMRKIIYLTTIKNGLPVSSGGFARIEKWNGEFFFHLAVPSGKYSNSLPVYVIYERDGELFPHSIGATEGGESWDARISLKMIRDTTAFDKIRGVLVGRPPEYLAGECPGYDGKIIFENVRFHTGEEEKPKEERSEDEKPDEVTAASFEDMLAQEPEKVQDSFLARLSEMYPFEDDEMEWCLQMEPKDFSFFFRWSFGITQKTVFSFRDFTIIGTYYMLTAGEKIMWEFRGSFTEESSIWPAVLVFPDLREHRTSG